MFCRNCGKELPENAKFCSACGTPVEVVPKAAEPEGTAPAEEAAPVEATAPVAEAAPVETTAPAVEAVPVEEAAPVTEAVPAPEVVPARETAVAAAAAAAPAVSPGGSEGPILTGKKRGSGLLLAGIAVVAAVVVVVALLIPVLTGGGGKGAYVYLTDDHELMFRKDLKVKTTAAELDDEALDTIFFSKDGKYLFFFSSDEDAVYADLYRIETAKIGKKNVEPEKISSDVYRYSMAVLDDGCAAYLKGNSGGSQLRFFDGKDSAKLASDVDYFSVNEAKTYAYYTEMDPNDYTETLYRVELKKDGQKEKLLDGASAIFSGYDADTLVYGKDNGEDTYDIYTLQPGGEKNKVLKDVSIVMGVESSGSKVSFSYLTDESESHTLYEFVTDRTADQDASAQQPNYSDYRVQTGPYSWNYTYDRDGYNAAYQAWADAQNRNNIRASLREWTYDISSYTLMRYEDGNETKLASGLSQYPECSPEDGVYLYTKADMEVKTVADVADLSYAGEIYDRLGSDEAEWFQNVGGTESSIDLEDAYGVELYVFGNEAALTCYSDDEIVLRGYTVGAAGLTSTGTICDDELSNVYVGPGKGGKDALYFYTDVDGEWEYGDFVRYQDGNKTVLAKEATRVDILDDGVTAFKLEDMDYNKNGVQECTLSLVDGDGSASKIADEVSTYNITYLGDKRVAYVSDGDLYIWNDGKAEKLATDVAYFWASDEESPDSYYCGYNS